ncbi:A24 family peptidase [Immundisolibacter sp.]|uniref:prepilin peptidase n=1 Tax=Immundisolibacter sp. TaxID=1934948 RepID=UPI00345B2A34|nr:A24 family peptidase [Immundisolibacter sp.]
MPVLGPPLATPALFTVACLLVGLVVGSFLNVVAHRLPVMLQRHWQTDTAPPGARYDLIAPGSHCPQCGAPIAWYHNVPLLGWLWLRGRCASCKARIPARYPLTELAGGLLAAAAALRFGPGFAAIAAAALSLTLLVLTRIDIEHLLLPDAITLPGVWAGLLVNLGGTFTDLRSAVIGAMAGYLSLWLVYHLFKWLTGKEGMGHGDFKLLALLGAWLGWQALPACILLASLLGSVYGLASIALAGRDRQQPFPFGPFLAVAGWLGLMWGEALRGAYLQALA